MTDKHTAAELARVKAVNEELVEVLILAKPILDGASVTAHESGQTMIPGARPVWDAIKAAIAKAKES